jgi:hypothetical protein
MIHSRTANERKSDRDPLFRRYPLPFKILFEYTRHKDLEHYFLLSCSLLIDNNFLAAFRPIKMHYIFLCLI